MIRENCDCDKGFRQSDLSDQLQVLAWSLFLKPGSASREQKHEQPSARLRYIQYLLLWSSGGKRRVAVS